MTRWSLRRHRHRAQRPVTGTYRLDPVQPELESAKAAGYRPDASAPGAGSAANGYAPGDYPRDAYRADAYQPDAAAGHTMTQPGAARAAQEATPEPTRSHAASGAWPEVMEQFGLHLLVLAEQLRISLDELEADEADPERLQKLYKVDHAVTRMRRASRDLRTLAGREQEELSGVDTSLLDVIRMALSAIERYTQVTIGKVADFGVLGYASDDVASLVAALLDNATRYSPGMTSVSAHLTEEGSVLLRIEDSGIGMSLDGVAALNAMLAGDVPELDDRTGRHTGFPVVHRIARKYSMAVRLAARPAPGRGTIALVTLPPELMSEIPDEDLDRPQAPPPPRTRQGSVSVLPTVRRAAEPPSGPAEAAGGGGASSGLPRRQPGSLRGGKPRPGSGFGSGSGSGSGGDGQAPGRSPEEQAATRRAFADDLTAFSLGGQDTAAGSGSVPAPRTQDPKGTPS
jgi:Histidine kinase-, DNA gyrase B-, and HSP90-like ATPase